MTTAVRATTRDAWADATRLATQEVLDDDVVAARRKAWLRRALPIVAGLVVIVVADLSFDAAVGSEAAVTPIWHVSSVVSESWTGVAVLGLLLTVVSNVRSPGDPLERAFVGPADLLPRAERARVRRQISAGTAVAADRRSVVIATARRMVHEGRSVLLRVGQVCLLAGLTLGSPTPFTVVLMTVLASCTVVAALRDQLWARRGRQWLTQHG